jgi:ankyrin repeat protein
MRIPNIRGISMTACCIPALLAATHALAAASPDAAPDTRVADAALHGEPALVRSLVAQHADVNAAQADGATALLWTVRADDRETTAFLLSHGADVKAANHYGVTALALAARNGSAPMIEALLKSGADVNTASPTGETVLMIAARSGHPDAVKVLLDHGANVNAKESTEQETALMYAAAENHAEVVRLLAEHGAEMNTRSRAMDPKAPRPRYPQSVGLRPVTGGLTPLLFAARQGSVEAARMLVDQKADPNLGDPNGNTPMIVAIMNGNFDVAVALLEKGANPNGVDGSGRTPLFAAVDMHKLEWLFSRPTPKTSGRLESTDLVKMLLDKGADPNARLTRRVGSFQHDTAENANLIAGATPFLKAASASDVPMMRLLIASGADPNLANENNTTPLMAAAGLNWRDISSVGSEADSTEAIKLCLAVGADVNAANKGLETAMHGAAQRGADSVVSFLVSIGGRLDVKAKDGRTPLIEAIGEAGEAKDQVDGRRPERVSTEALIRKLISQKAENLTQTSEGGQ